MIQTPAPAIRFEEVLIPASEFVDAATPEHKLCLVLEGQARLSFRSDDRWRSVDIGPGMFAPVTPPRVEAPLRLSAPQRHLLVTVDEAAFQRVSSRATHSGNDLGWLHERAFRNPFLAQLCLRVHRESRAGDALGDGFVEASRDLLVHALLRLSAPSAVVSRRTPPLGRTVVDDIREYCEARMDQRITVPELAALAGLGSDQFSRCFKAATGTTPRQFLTALRLDRARRLLADSRLPLAEVALRCGFSDQAHFATAFARGSGLSPARYRRQHRRGTTAIQRGR